MNERVHDWQWMGVVLMTALSLLAASGCGGPEPLRFTVLFEDAAGLEAGMPVEYRGLEIGKVLDVGLDDQGLVAVTVRVEDEYRSAVTHSSTLRSETRGIRRRPHLMVREGESEGERRAVQDGDVLTGSPRMLDDALTRLQEGARSAWQSTAEAASELQEKLSEAARESQEEFRRLQRENAPELRRQAEKVRQQLEEAGMEEEAAKFWQDFEQWLEKLETADPDSNPGADSPPPAPPQ